MTHQLDLTPHPRVLQMLGEINLPQWRCLAELIDNSIDGFVNSKRAERSIPNPEIVISLPTRDEESARLTVRDNGPGMSIDSLENALKAGWTGNDPLSNLGLFGMGFNIASARLGLVTEVWTTRAGDKEWLGVRIDLEELRRSKHFLVARQARPKADAAGHGTEVTITRLKAEQRTFFSRAANLSNVRRNLAKTYSVLLGVYDEVPVRLMVNGVRLEPRRHCVWDRDRTVELPNGSIARAVEVFDFQMAPRRYCTTCMLTLPPDATTCSTGSKDCYVVETQRSLRGWIGLQRYLDETDFGIDFIRNSRKIEVGNKDLFSWTDGESSDVEYPIDDPRNRGRFVGEIHLDHCRVSYTKDRFERNDPAWAEMVKLIRGEGPLQPLKARALGIQGNDTPLYRLFQAFRRSSPQGKSGLWSRILVVQNNDLAQQMADKFHKNDPEYLSDEKWWEVVQEQDRKILTPEGDKEKSSPGPSIPPGFLGGDVGAGTAIPETLPAANEPPPKLERHPLRELSRKYVHPTFRVEYEVQAYDSESSDPDLSNAPWSLKLEDVSTRTYAFIVQTSHEIFRSTTMTPLDGLLAELAYRTVDFLKGQVQNVSFATVLADFRGEYSQISRLEPKEIISAAVGTLADIAGSIAEKVNNQGQSLFDELTQEERDAIGRRMATREVPNHKAAINDGSFLSYAEPQTISAFVGRHPELFFDGHFWDDAYLSLDYGSAAVTSEARDRVQKKFEAYLADAVWLARQAPGDLERVDRDALARATYSLRLLRPDTGD
jgi:hypothetical protein